MPESDDGTSANHSKATCFLIADRVQVPMPSIAAGYQCGLYIYLLNLITAYERFCHCVADGKQNTRLLQVTISVYNPPV